MHIGGLQKSSMIDYPGKISCVVFLSGCNFACPYCHNPALVKGMSSDAPAMSPEMLFDFLAVRRNFLDGVVISGGEPTLQEDLPDLCGRVKEMGYPVKLDTNGSRPGVIGDLIRRGLVDYLAMDIKTDPFSYSPYIHKSIDPEKLLSSIRRIMVSGLPYEFRTTCIRPLVDEKILEGICGMIRGAGQYVLQQFHDAAVLHPEFFQGQNRLFSDRELADLKAVCAPWVQTCTVR
jgi:pyruvate formate lyase activating enzyme